jgi:hypothetical protein
MLNDKIKKKISFKEGKKTKKTRVNLLDLCKGLKYVAY